jgi:hypothetical protein
MSKVIGGQLPKLDVAYRWHDVPGEMRPVFLDCPFSSLSSGNQRVEMGQVFVDELADSDLRHWSNLAATLFREELVSFGFRGCAGSGREREHPPPTVEILVPDHEPALPAPGHPLVEIVSEPFTPTRITLVLHQD